MSISTESDRIRQNLKILKKEAQKISTKESKPREQIVYTRQSVSGVMNRSVAAWTMKGCDTYEKLEEYLVENPDKIAPSQILIWTDNLPRYKEIFAAHKEDQELKKVNKRRCFTCETIKTKKEFKLFPDGKIDGYQCKECRKPKEII